jgi:hypothetical protein
VIVFDKYLLAKFAKNIKYVTPLIKPNQTKPNYEIFRSGIESTFQIVKA